MRSVLACIRLLLLAGILALIALPAFASTTRCPTNTLCLWSKPRYDGKRVKVVSQGVTDVAELNDKASSLKNRTARSIFLFDGSAGTGVARCVGAGGATKSLKMASFDFDNRTSSVKIPSIDLSCVDGHPPTALIQSPDNAET